MYYFNISVLENIRSLSPSLVPNAAEFTPLQRALAAIQFNAQCMSTPVSSKSIVNSSIQPLESGLESSTPDSDQLRLNPDSSRYGDYEKKTGIRTKG